jgi:hypothetical protein
MIHLLLLPLLAASPASVANPAAAQPAAPAATVQAASGNCLAKSFGSGAFSPAAGRTNLTCACTPTITDCGPEVYDSADFLYQKADGVCVYLCHFHQDCTQVSCDCAESPVQTFGQNRSRVGPVAPGACPPADTSLCA